MFNHEEEFAIGAIFCKHTAEDRCRRDVRVTEEGCEKPLTFAVPDIMTCYCKHGTKLLEHKERKSLLSLIILQLLEGWRVTL